MILVSDAMKFTRSAPVRIGHMSQLSAFVTDRPPPESILAICRQNGVRLELVNPDMTEARAHHDT